MKSKKVLIIIAAILLVVIFIFNSKKDPKEITIGVISGMSGSYAVVGESFVNGVTLAQEEWNKENPNTQIKTIVENDEFVPTKGLSAYKKLSEIDKVDSLINMTTFTIDVIYDDIVSKNLPVAQGFVQSIASEKDSVIQLWPGAVPAEIKLGEYIREKGYKNVAVFVDNRSAAFTMFSNGFKEGYQMPVTEFKVSSETTDLRSAALKAYDLKPDAVVFIVQPDQGVTLVKEFSKISANKIQFVFDANIQTGFETYRTLLGDTNVLNGSILYTVPTNYTSEFTSKYKERFGTEPGVGSETGYNAFKLLSMTYDSNRNAWIKSMQEVTFVGADGKIVLDEFGVRIPELKLGTIENGELPQ